LSTRKTGQLRGPFVPQCAIPVDDSAVVCGEFVVAVAAGRNSGIPGSPIRLAYLLIYIIAFE